MRTERIIRHNRFRHKIRTLRRHPRVDRLAAVTVEPTIKDTILHRRHIIGHKVTTELVTFIDSSPERTALRMPGESIWVAQSRSKDSSVAGGNIDLENGGTVNLVIQAVFTHV